MENTSTTATNISVTPDDVRKLLRKTDWAEYNRRVIARVAKKAEEYRHADAQALEKAQQTAFI